MRYLARALLIFALLWSGAALAQETEEEARDRGILTRLIEDNLSTVSRTVTVLGFKGALSSRATVETILIGDRDGIWLRAEGLVLDWDRAALFGRRIDINELSAERIEILRPPIPDPDLPEAEAKPFALPELPVSIEIDMLRAAEVVLGEPLLGEEMRVLLEGQVQLVDGEGAADIDALRIDGDGQFSIDAKYSNQTENLALDVALNEPEDGLIARVLGLPERPSVDLSLAGDGPISDYRAQLILATAGVERATGSFGFISATGPDGRDRLDLRADISGDIAPLLPPDYAVFFGDESRLALQVQRQETGEVSLPVLTVETSLLTLDGSAEIRPDGWPERLSLIGRIADETGDPVLLPLPGPRTFVQDVVLDVTYDAASADAWNGQFAIEGLSRPEIRIGTLKLDGGGVILPTADATPGNFTANLVFSADDIDLTDEGLSEAIGTSGNGIISMVRTEEGGVFIERLTLDGPGLSLEADAEVSPPSDGILTEATVWFRVDELDRLATLSGLDDLGGAAELTTILSYRPLTGAFDLNLSGQAEELVLGIPELDPLLAGYSQIALSADRDETGTRIRALNLHGPEVTIIGSGEITSERTDAHLQLDISDIGLSVPGLSGPGTLSMLADRQPGLGTNLSLDLMAPDVELVARARIAPKAEGLGVVADGSLRIAEIGPYAGLADLPLTGGLQAAFETEGSRGLETFVAALSGTGTDLALGDARIDPFLAGQTRLTASLTRDAGDLFVLNSLDLEASDMGLEASGRYDAGAVNAELEARVSDLARIDPRLDGELRLRGLVDRQRDGALSADLTATGPGGLDLDVTAAGTSDGANPVTFRAGARLTDASPYSAFAGRDIAGAADLEIDGTANRDFQTVDAMLSGRLSDTAIGMAQFDQLLAGVIRLGGRFSRTADGDLAITGLDIDGDAIGLEADARRFADGALEARFAAAISDLARADGRLAGTARLGGQVAVEADGALNALIDLTGPGGLDGNVMAEGAAGAPVSVVADIAVADASPYAALAGQSIGGALSVTTDGTVTRNLAFIDMAVAAETDGLRTGNPYGDTVLAGSGSVSARVIRGSDGLIVFDGLRVAYPNLTVNGTLKGRGTTGSADFDATLRDIGLFTDELSGPVTAVGSAGRDDAGRWVLDTDVTGPGGIGARIDGFVAGTTLALDIVGEAPLGLANRAIEPHRVRGVANFDLRVDGPPALSSLSGTIQSTGARFAIPAIGRALEDLSLAVRLTGGTADIDLGGDISGGGRLVVGGTMQLTGQLASNLLIRADDVVLRDPALYETVADAEVTLTGPMRANGVIAGTVQLGEVNLQIPSSGFGTLGALPTVRHIGATVPIRRTLDRAGVALNGTNPNRGSSGSTPGLSLDLSILAPDRIFVRGRGLDAELGGTLRIGGTTRRAIPSGQFSLVRGRLDILQQRFILDEGTLTISGDFVPFLRLVASTEAEDGTFVRVIVEGPANSPVITFESQPELPQDEILARLIFGRDLTQISALQAVQLASAAATLAGRGGAGIVGNIRESVGLDDLDITSDDDGNVAVQAGVYLGENVYSDVTVGAERTEIELNLDLTDDITVTGRANSDGETALGIFFERDY